MLTMQEWMELVDYKITEGSEYFASLKENSPRLFSLSSWDGEQEGSSFFVAFDTKTQEVYSVEAHDFKNRRSYRIKHPDLDVDNNAYDGVDFVDLESDDDFIQKAIAIKNGEAYDTRVSIPIELPDDELFALMKLAHERDMTFNQLVELALTEALEKYEAEMRAEHGVYS